MSSSGGTLLPSFPKIETLTLPPSIPSDKVKYERHSLHFVVDVLQPLERHAGLYTIYLMTLILLYTVGCFKLLRFGIKSGFLKPIMSNLAQIV